MDSSFIRPGADASRARREAGGAPPRSWRTWLFGRPLATSVEARAMLGLGRSAARTQESVLQGALP